MTAACARYLDAARRLSAARHALAPGLFAAARTAAGGAGDGAHAVRGAVQRRTAARAGVDGRRRRRGRVLHFAESGRGSAAAGANRLRWRAVAHHARHQDPDRRAPSWVQRGRRPARRAASRRDWCSTRSTPASVGGPPTSSAESFARSARHFRYSVLPTCRRLPRTRTRTFSSRSRSTAAERRRASPGSTTAAASRSWRGCSAAIPITDALRATAREMLVGRQIGVTPTGGRIHGRAGSEFGGAGQGESKSKGESERAKGERAKRKPSSTPRTAG